MLINALFVYKTVLHAIAAQIVPAVRMVIIMFLLLTNALNVLIIAPNVPPKIYVVSVILVIIISLIVAQPVFLDVLCVILLQIVLHVLMDIQILMVFVINVNSIVTLVILRFASLVIMALITLTEFVLILLNKRNNTVYLHTYSHLS